MELRVLRYFLTVVQEESISGAAARMNLTQPTLSRQLQELEEELGVNLFQRGKRNRKIILTEEGLLLRRRAEEIVALADRTQAELQTPGDAVEGDIYIGSGETEAMRLIAQAAKSLSQKYPNIRYHLHSGNADDVGERLDNGLLDFGVFVEPANVEKYDYIRLPYMDTWGLLMRKDCELASKSFVTANDLEGLPLLTSRQSMTQNMLSGWCGRDIESLNIVATYNLLFNASLMVDEGVGYALCLDRLINTGGTSNLCFRPLEPRLETYLDIVWKKRQVHSKATALFLEVLQHTFSA